MHDIDIDADFRRFREHNDLRALARVFDRAAPLLLPVARHLAKRREDADDLLQATFLTAIQKSSSWDVSRPLMPWLLGMMSLHAHKLRRVEGRLVESDRLNPREVETPDSSAARREFGVAVVAAVSKLPETYAGVVRRHLLDGLASTEIASEFGLTPVNARVRLHRGLRLLRQSIPSGFAGFAWFRAPTWMALRSVRARVLRHAAQWTGRPVPLSVAPFAVTAFAAAALLVPVFALREAEVSEFAESASPLVVETNETVEFMEPTGSRAEVAEAAPLVPQSSSTVATSALIRGRVVDSAGVALAGARIEVSRGIANRRLARAVELDAETLAVVESTTDAEGRFEVSCEVHPATNVRLRAATAGFATACYSWGELAAGSSNDLGQVELERAARLNLEVRDSTGRRLGKHWTVDFSQKADDPAGPRTVYTRRITPNEAESVLIDDLPAGAIQVRAGSGILAKLDTRVVTTELGTTSELVLVHAGPDVSASIGIDCSRLEGVWAGLPPSSKFVLIDAHGEKRAASGAGASIGYRFDGVAPGRFTVVFDDPNYRAAKIENVEPGQTVRIDLIGSSSVRLVWKRGPAPERFDLSAVRTGSGTSSPMGLLTKSQTPPPNGLFDAFVAGDYELRLEVPGERARTLSVPAIAAGEVREVIVDAPADASLNGVVVDAEGRTLANIEVMAARRRGEGANIRVERPTSSRGGTTSVSYTRAGGMERSVNAELVLKTDENGRFSATKLEPGAWVISARWNELLRCDTSVELKPESSGEVVLKAPPQGGIEGRVTNANADSLAWMSLEITDAAQAARSVLVPLASDGTFRFGPVAVGEYRAVLAPRAAKSGSTLSSFEVFSSAPAAPTSEQRLSVQPNVVTKFELSAAGIAPGMLDATVSLDGEFAKGCTVVASSVGSTPRSTRVETEVDASGVARLAPLSPGEYVLEVRNANATWAYVHGQRVTVESGQHAALAVAVQTTRRTLRFEDASGKPLSYRSIRWRTGSSQIEASASTRSDGEVVLSLPLSEVTFTCPGVQLVDGTFVWSAGEDVLVLRAK